MKDIDVLQSLEEREKLINLFEKYGNLLPQSQKQVFQLYFIEDISQVEIADIIATSRQAVNDALKKSTTKLLQLEKKLG